MGKTKVIIPDEHTKRSNAAKKAWETIRHNARSNVAKKAWETRRANKKQ
jgi:hypothetical protein